MLLQNARSDDAEPRYYSSLVGMEVEKARRGEGLSKIFVAIWLRICLKTGCYPRAAVMNKPLIAYVLMSFNFLPQNGGSKVELIRLKNDGSKMRDSGEDEGDYNPQFALRPSSAKSLRGLFSHRTLRTQNIAILDNLPANLPRGASRGNRTVIYLKTRFEHPISIAERAVEYIPPPSLQSDIGSQTFEVSAQRHLLDRQLHSVLKTNDGKGTVATGQLDFFSNSTMLECAFLSHVGKF